MRQNAKTDLSSSRRQLPLCPLCSGSSHLCKHRLAGRLSPRSRGAVSPPKCSDGPSWPLHIPNPVSDPSDPRSPTQPANAPSLFGRKRGEQRASTTSHSRPAVAAVCPSPVAAALPVEAPLWCPVLPSPCRLTVEVASTSAPALHSALTLYAARALHPTPALHPPSAFLPLIETLAPAHRMRKRALLACGVFRLLSGPREMRENHTD